MERKWRRTRLLCDRVNNEKQCAECRDLIYKTKKDYFNTVISENIHDQRVLFQTVNHLLSGGIKDTEYPTCSDDKTLAEVFINFFTSKINGILSDLQRSGTSDTLEVSSQCKSTFLNFDIVSSNEICKLIKSSVKSCSLDPVPSLLGCRMAIPVGKWVEFLRFIIFIFFRVGKSLACHSPGKWCLCA